MNSLTQKSIELILNRLYFHTFNYPEIENKLDIYNQSIEPDYPRLYTFRDKLLSTICIFGSMQKSNILKDDIQDLLELVYYIGTLYGHIRGNSTTGTWGVRYSCLREAYALLDFEPSINIGDVHYFQNGFIDDRWDPAYVTKIEPTTYGIEYYLTPIDRRVNSWSLCDWYGSILYNRELEKLNITKG